jgi:hypothetical protein
MRARQQSICLPSFGLSSLLRLSFSEFLQLFLGSKMSRLKSMIQLSAIFAISNSDVLFVMDDFIIMGISMIG